MDRHPYGYKCIGCSEPMMVAVVATEELKKDVMGSLQADRWWAIPDCRSPVTKGDPRLDRKANEICQRCSLATSWHKW